ncbi:MAG: hypothetical protein FD156_860 [Nitrospirae bacterium]|nr:MAG: hypothetical protein FD156_860 [Nitrospirota bacterium]
MKLLKNFLDFFLSLRTAIWLLLGLILMLFFGAVIMPSREEFSTINSTPLLGWLKDSPLGATWWLWGSITLLSLLAANTLLCSVESLLKKRQHRAWLLIISPQIIHIGFLFILLAHFLSSAGSFKNNAVAYEGSAFLLPNNLTVKVNDINININSSGYISDWAVNIEYFSGNEKIKEDSLGPNSPSFYKGLGIYLKDIQPYPLKAVLLEVTKEPGAAWALVGGILFMLGTITLLILKIKREPY